MFTVHTWTAWTLTSIRAMTLMTAVRTSHYALSNITDAVSLVIDLLDTAPDLSAC